MNHVYRKKPVQIEAFQITKERMQNNTDWPHWLHEAWNLDAGVINSLSIHSYDFRDNTAYRYSLKTSSGDAVVYQGDWIIKGVMGELYPCDDAVFRATYDADDAVVALKPERNERLLTRHNQPGAVQFPLIEVLDDPGSGGAHHVYRMGGPEQPSLHVQFQNGPVNEVGINGTTNEALLCVVIDRLRCFQDGPFACHENAKALNAAEESLLWLQKRTKDRLARGVEGKSKE